MPFISVTLPTNQDVFIPSDITIVLPNDNELTEEQRHRLAYIPWSNHYLSKVPEKYHDFFQSVLPLLHIRTTDVHTALSVAQLPFVLLDPPEKVNEHLLYLAIILHDVGWSEVSPSAIADSLSYTGLELSAASRTPKQQHVIFGEALAYKLLTAYPIEKLNLTYDDVFTITEMIRRHDYDAPWEKGKYGPISLETNLLCDCDRLWSYTHENFWLDTIRKIVSPEKYIETLKNSIENYFFTTAGKNRAHALVRERRKEVEDYRTRSTPR